MGHSSTAKKRLPRDAVSKIAQQRLSVLELARELGNGEADRGPMYGWPLRGKCGFGSGVWHFAAMYSASLMQRFSARLDEVRRVQVQSVDRDQVAWGHAGCPVPLVCRLPSPHSAPCRLGLPEIRQHYWQIIMRPGNSGRFSAGPRWFWPSCWRLR